MLGRAHAGRRLLASAITLGVLLVVGLGAAVAAGTIPGPGGTIQGCYNQATGLLRVVSDASQCLTSSSALVQRNPALLEVSLAWQQSGASASDVSALQTRVANLEATVTALGTSSGPSITSFTAANPFLTNGGQTALSATFTGSGVIDHGVGPITSGRSVVITPPTSATTTYTLTATDSAGRTATATLTVTTVPPPIIQSFTASPTSLPFGGGGVALTPTFTGGTGFIQRFGSVNSGALLVDTVTSTTTYVLLVTNPAGTTATAQVTVTVGP